MADEHFFDVLQLPLRPRRPRAPRLRSVGTRRAHRERGAAAFSAPTNPIGRTLTVDPPRRLDADFRVTGVLRDLPRNSHLDLADGEPPSTQRSSPTSREFLTELAGTAGWPTMSGCGPAPTSPRSTPRCRPGRSAHPATRSAASAVQAGRQSGLASRERPRRPSRRAPRKAAMTPGQRPHDDRDLRGRRPADPRHGLRQFHQPRHRPRHPAGPRGGAEQGAGRDARGS